MNRPRGSVGAGEGRLSHDRCQAKTNRVHSIIGRSRCDSAASRTSPHHRQATSRRNTRHPCFVPLFYFAHLVTIIHFAVSAAFQPHSMAFHAPAVSVSFATGPDTASWTASLQCRRAFSPPPLNCARLCRLSSGFHKVLHGSQRHAAQGNCTLRLPQLHRHISKASARSKPRLPRHLQVRRAVNMTRGSVTDNAQHRETCPACVTPSPGRPPLVSWPASTPPHLEMVLSRNCVSSRNQEWSD